MRVGFAGTPAFAVAALTAILDAGYHVPLVLTRPDRPKGRGLRVEHSAVKRLAEARSLPIAQPETLTTLAACAGVIDVALDVLVVAAYGLLLPSHVLQWPRAGCLNIHASLLPRWRGAAPIQRALLAGDAETGVTIMQMDAGLDTGTMLRRSHVPIEPRETAGTLHDKLAAAGAQAIVDQLHELARDERTEAVPQPADGVTYAAKIGRADTAIDWRANATVIDRQVRAFDPVPGAHTSLAGVATKVWAAEPCSPRGCAGRPGAVIGASEGDLLVACGEGVLRILELQPAGGKRMTARAFVVGRRLALDACFDVKPA